MDDRQEPYHPTKGTYRPSSSQPKPRAPQRHWVRRWLPAVVIIVIAVAVGYYLLSGKHATTPRAGRGQSQNTPVGVATIGRGDIQILLNGLGTVTPLASVTVRTQISGQLLDVGFTEGQLVHKGDFLAQIDPRPYQVILEQAQAQMVKDQALLQNAQTDLARYQKLFKEDSIAQQQVATQASLVRQDQGAVAVDQAAIDAAKLNVAYCHIVSPVTGRVGLRQVDPGNYVQASDSNGLVVVTQLQPISVVSTLTEDAVPAVMQRVAGGAKLPVDAYDRSNTTKLATGMLAAIDNQVDVTTGTVKIRTSFDNTDSALFPSQFVNVRLLVNTKKNVIEAPVAAVQTGAPGTFVYLLKPDNTVAVTVIKTGASQGQMIEVTSGLSEGDKVVVEGTDRLRDGAKVTVPPPNPAANPAATPAANPGVAPPAGQPAGGTTPAAPAGATPAGTTPPAGQTPDSSTNPAANGQEHHHSGKHRKPSSQSDQQ